MRRDRLTPGEVFLKRLGYFERNRTHGGKDGFIQEHILLPGFIRGQVELSPGRERGLVGAEAISGMMLRELDAAIADLPRVQAEALWLRATGHTATEVAAIQGRAKQNVLDSERRARVNLERREFALAISQTYRELVHRPRYHRSCGRVRLAA